MQFLEGLSPPIAKALMSQLKLRPQEPLFLIDAAWKAETSSLIEAQQRMRRAY
jgi:hypothetical protein